MVLGPHSMSCTRPSVWSNCEFVFISRKQRTWVSSLPLMCCGSKAERGGITTTPLEAVTGLLPIRGWTCRPSRPSSSNQTSRILRFTLGGRHQTCCEACFWVLTAEQRIYQQGEMLHFIHTRDIFNHEHVIWTVCVCVFNVCFLRYTNTFCSHLIAFKQHF